MQGDEQKPDRRCGTLGASGHGTAKPSIRDGACFINPAFMHGKLRILPREISLVPWEVACDGNWLRAERLVLTAGEKSAEGIVGDLQARLVRHSRAERRRNGYAEP